MKTNKRKTTVLNLLKKRAPLRLGFLPENDCAPLVVAQEFGLFQRFDLEVRLYGEPSWKHIYNKMMAGMLDGAHVPAMLPFLINLGLTPEKSDCLTGLVLNLQGNAITVSRELWRLGVRDSATMRERIWQDRHRKTYTFGVACPLSGQYSLLCQWLKSTNAPAYPEVRIEPVPPEQLFPLLKLGYLDGYCAGEPWNSVAVQAGVGVCITTSAQLAPLHPEKILMVTRDFAETRADEHERLIAALLEACRLCDQAEHRGLICELLAKPQFVNAPMECLQPDLLGPFGAEGSSVYSLQGLNIFSRCKANEPSAAKAAWLTGRLFGFLRWTNRPAALKNVFRPDIFRRAQGLVAKPYAVELRPERLAQESWPATVRCN